MHVKRVEISSYNMQNSTTKRPFPSERSSDLNESQRLLPSKEKKKKKKMLQINFYGSNLTGVITIPGGKKATPAHAIPTESPVLPHPLEMPYLFWPRRQAWSRAWFRKGLGRADNPERKTRALRTRCPGIPRQPSWRSPGSHPPAAASVGSPAGLWPRRLGGWRRSRTQLGRQPQLCSLVSALPSALRSCLPPGFGRRRYLPVWATGRETPLETPELGSTQREERLLRLTLTLLPGPFVSSWETLLENRTLWHHVPEQAEAPPADASSKKCLACAWTNRLPVHAWERGKLHFSPNPCCILASSLSEILLGGGGKKTKNKKNLCCCQSSQAWMEQVPQKKIKSPQKTAPSRNGPILQWTSLDFSTPHSENTCQQHYW